MDRMTTNILVFQRIANDLELLTEIELDDENREFVPVVLPLPLAA